MDYVVEIMVLVVNFLNDEMKGCIIGWEGCNICMFEMLIGIDLIIDDIFEVVIFFGFDLIRCEIVRIVFDKFV